MRIFLFLALTFILLPALALAGTKTFYVTVEEVVSKNQSQEAVEAFALQKAKRLAVEAAGTFLSSMAVVEKGRLTKDEITALAAGIVRSEVVSSDALIRNKVLTVKIRARVVVDTSVLEKQVEALLEDRASLREIEKKDQRLRELEAQLAQVQKADLARLKELNAQAIALETERERHRLFLEEQRVKAEGDIAKADLKRIKDERERAERFEKLRKDQEAIRHRELKAINLEQDRIRKAQMENEAKVRELAHTAELSRANWLPIDDLLSANQAREEAENIRKEFRDLEARFDVRYLQAEANLKEAYKNQIAATVPILPLSPAPKDPFETTQEYNRRLDQHASKIKMAQDKNTEKVAALKYEQGLKIVETRLQSLEQQYQILRPFSDRLAQLQNPLFMLPEGTLKVELGAPDSDHSRFPLNLLYKNKSYKTFWTYQDRDKARLFYQTRAHLMAEPLFKLEPGDGDSVHFAFAGARVAHPGTKEKRDLMLFEPAPFPEISKVQSLEETAYNEKLILRNSGEISRDGIYVAYGNGIVRNDSSGLEWLASPNKDILWDDAKSWIENLKTGGSGWRMPTLIELHSLYSKGSGDRNRTSLLKTTVWLVWSGEVKDSSCAWVFNFSTGKEDWLGRASSQGIGTLAVRSKKY